MSQENSRSWLRKGLAATTLGAAGLVAEAGEPPMPVQDKGPPITDVRKAADAPKGTRRGDDEFDKLRKIAPETAMLETVLGLTTPVKGLGTLIGAVRTGQTQAEYAVVPLGEVERGKWKGFQDAFNDAYKFDRLPGNIKTPTKTGVFVIEDSPVDASEKLPFIHGHGVTAVALAAGKAITGKDSTVHLMNEQVFDGYVGKRIVDVKRAPTGNARAMGPDLAHGILRRNYYDKNSVNVVSVSMVGINPELKSRKDRLKYNEQLSNHFGDNAMFVVASGNGITPMFITFRHNALRYHPHTLVIGAANQVRVEGPGGPFNAYSATEYSTPGADVTMPAIPSIDARYAIATPNGMRHLPFNGTSSATPQAANGIIAPLISRFAASAENPKAVLTPEDVFLAIKNTAKPIHAVIDSGFSFDLRVEPPTATQTPRKVVPVTNYEVAGHYASKHGNGEIDLASAWKLLERQEKAVKDGKAQVLQRKDAHVSLAPKEHTLGSDSYYRYKLNVEDDLYADRVILDLVSKELGKKMQLENADSRPRVFLTNPAGEMLEIEPSSAYRKTVTPLPGGFVREDLDGVPYVIGSAAGMQGSAMKGTWTVLSTEPLDQIDLNFDHAMQPGHVGVKIRRDPEEAKRNLYRHADFTAHSREQLDALVAPGSAMLKHDLSETGFPSGYTDMRLISAVRGNDQKFALELVEARYNSMKHKDALVKAVKSGDGTKVVEALVPEGRKLQFFKTAIRTLSKEDAIYLVKNGFGDIKEEVKGPRGEKRFNTTLHEYVKQMGEKADPEVVKEFLKAGADAHTRDARGRTPLHWARYHLVQGVLIDVDLNGPQGTRVIDVRDDNGKNYMELPWDLSNEIGMASPIRNQDHVARLEENRSSPDTART